MNAHTPRTVTGFASEGMALDAVRTAFGWLVTGPDPLAVDGRHLVGLPARTVPLDELRGLLLDRGCPQQVRDAVWAHLITQSRDRGGAWTVGCAGVALPALTRIAAILTARFAGDPADVHAAVLTGFLDGLARIALDRPRIMLRLRWAAYRAGHASVREALDAPIPTGPTPAPHSTPVAGAAIGAGVGGHPDLVLARAVADGVLTAEEAGLIGSTRLDGMALAAAAAARGAGYEATKKARRRAEHRLAAYLRAQASEPVTDPTDTDPAAPHPTDRRGDPTSSHAAPAGPPDWPQSRSVTTPGRPGGRPRAASTAAGVPMGPSGRSSGVRPPRRAPAVAGRASERSPGRGGAPMRPAPTPRPPRRPGAATTRPVGAPPSAGGPQHHSWRGDRRGDRQRPVWRGGAALALVLGLVVAVAVYGSPGHAMAGEALHAIPVAAPPASIGQVLNNLRTWLIGILAGLATLFLTLGGVRYVMANGDPGEIEKAKTAFRGAGIGYGLAVLAPLVVSVLQSIVGS